MAIHIEKLPEALKKKGIKEKLTENCTKNDIIFLAVFGSFIRGEQNRKSDVDIAIEFDETKGKSLLDLIHIEDELSGIFGRKVDFGNIQQFKAWNNRLC